MRTDELDYELPPGLIAQHPASPRDSARLLVSDRGAAIRHRTFSDLPDELWDEDLVVINDTRVLPARVRAHRATGGSAEVLLLEPAGDGRWQALVRPYRRLRDGERLSAGALEIEIVEHQGEGRALVRPAAEGSLEEALRSAGEMPLPPYITEPLTDPDEYQTVYARDPGSAAAPTAGLHFTPVLLERLRRSHEVVSVTLDVGLDTFRPVAEDDLDGHRIHTESYRVGPAAAESIRGALDAGRRDRRRRHDHGARAGDGVRRGCRAAGGTHGADDPARAPLPRRRRDADQLPSSAIDPAGAGDGVRRCRADA